MQLTSLSLALTRAGFLSFSPASLFAAGEPGVWYEPSLTNGTCFQDSAGTTPVTAAEQPVGLILDKSKGLVLGPELVVNGDFSDGANGWTVGDGWNVSGGVAISSVDASKNLLQTAISIVAGKTYRVTYTASNVSVNAVRINVWRPGDTFQTGYLNLNGNVSVVFTATVSGSFGLFCYAAGVTIDNISVRELPGNHATQTTSTSRPVLSARYNLLTKTEQLTDVIWTTTGTKGTLANGLTPVSFATTETDRRSIFTHAISGIVTAAGQEVILRGRFEVNPSMPTIALGWGAGVRFGWAAYNTLTGTWSNYVISTIGSFVGVSAQEISPNVWEITVIATSGANSPAGILAHAGTGNASDLRLNAPIGSVSVGFIDARFGNVGVGLPVYQRVNTTTDYDTVGFKPYLRFDGVDDFLVTNSINFTATDKMTVFAGVRKLSDAATAMLVELGTDAGTVNGSFHVQTSVNTYGFALRGTAVGLLSATTFTAPITNVFSASMDISQATLVGELKPRINGSIPTLAATIAGPAGTGNFGNYPLYIGRRGGTTLPANMNLYSLIVRGAQSNAGQIGNTETWVNSKTGAY